MAKKKGYRNFGGAKMRCDIPDGDISDNSQVAFCKAGKDSLNMAILAARDCEVGWMTHHLMTAGVMYGNANPGTSICNCDDAVGMKRATAHAVKQALKRCKGEFQKDEEPAGKHRRK